MVILSISTAILAKHAQHVDKAGTYPYFCSVHPKMTGKIIVKLIPA